MRRRLALLLAAALGALLLPQPAGAITGGQPADDGEWPWQVVLLVDGGQWCGGSIVSLDIVVTAAHCTDGVDARDFEVIAGSIDLDGEGGQRRGVAEIRQHEDYDDIAIRNDIALLVLDEPFEATDAVQPVSLPDPATGAERTKGGDPAFVTGFGATSEDGGGSDVLLEAAIEIVADDTCRAEYAQDGSTVFADSQVCAGRERGHVDACFGDSGGPLVVPAAGDEGDEPEFLLVGIVSWGAGCGAAFRPTVYTEVVAFLDWLADNGASGVEGERFESATPLRIPAVGSEGKAGPYPATVAVAGLEGELTEVAVELRGLSHERPEDLDVWLQAPDGTTIVLFSDVGGDEPIEDRTVVVRVGGPEAGERALAVQFAPTDREDDPQRKAADEGADLGILTGVDPEGDWRLLVADDRAGASGSLAGWALILG